MTTSAKCTYSAVPMAGVFNYEVQLHNTSPYPYDIYGFLFGWQFEMGHYVPFPLKDVVLISFQPGWSGFSATPGIFYQTNFQGSAIASGYILPGQFGKFVFQSSTGTPPAQLPFACAFYNNANEFGFLFNGTAHLVDPGSVPSVPWVPPIYNPWWWIDTRGGLVPPGPPPPWLQEFVAALALSGDARISPKLRVGLLERALEQIPIATAAIKEEIKALQKEIERG